MSDHFWALCDIGSVADVGGSQIDEVVHASKLVITDRLPSYGAAMKEIGNEGCQEVGRHLNNRAENSHFPFRRRTRAMSRF